MQSAREYAEVLAKDDEDEVKLVKVIGESKSVFQMVAA